MQKDRGIAVLCLVIAVSAGAVSAAGVFLRGDGASAQAMSVRGENYEYATSGIYRFNALRIVTEGIGWDLVTLGIAVPAMIAAAAGIARRSFRGRLIALGLLVYFFYQYLEYAVFWAFGPLFLLYVGIFGASLAGIAWIGSEIDLQKLPSRFLPGFPRRGMAMLSLFLSVVLLLMWIPLVLRAMLGRIDGVLFGSTTLVVQALDLGLIVPLAVFTGVSAWRGKAVGYLLSSVFAVKTITMGSALCAMILNVWYESGKLDLIPLIIFGSAVIIATGLGIKMFRSVT